MAGGKHAQLWRQFALPWRLAREPFHVYHGAQFALPLISKVPRVAPVHDLSFIKSARAYQWRTRVHFRTLLRLSLWGERIITPSKAVADDLVRETSYPRSRIRVVHLAPATTELVDQELL